MAEALTFPFRRALVWLGAAALAVLLARPWWQPADQAALLRLDAACLIGMAAGLTLAVMVWTAPARIRGWLTLMLLGLSMGAPWRVFAVLVAFPCTAALRRAPPSVLAEAQAAGAGPLRRAAGIILPLALPGLIYGALLVLAAAPAGRLAQLAAAAVPLLW